MRLNDSPLQRALKFTGWQTNYVRTPIACTLTPEAVTDRLSEWQRFLAESTGAVERVSQQRLRIRLNASTSATLGAIDLARREKAWCSFFEFSIAIEEESSWLTVEVPPDAIDVLNRFVLLLPQKR